MFRIGKSIKTESRLIGCQGLQGENPREWVLMAMRFLCGMAKCSGISVGDGCRACGPTKNCWILEGWVVWYVNHISIKLSFKKTKQKKTRREDHAWSEPVKFFFLGTTFWDSPLQVLKRPILLLWRSMTSDPSHPKLVETTAAAFANCKGKGIRDCGRWEEGSFWLPLG